MWLLAFTTAIIWAGVVAFSLRVDTSRRLRANQAYNSYLTSLASPSLEHIVAR